MLEKCNFFMIYDVTRQSFEASERNIGPQSL